MSIFALFRSIEGNVLIEFPFDIMSYEYKLEFEMFPEELIEPSQVWNSVYRNLQVRVQDAIWQVFPEHSVLFKQNFFYKNKEQIHMEIEEGNHIPFMIVESPEHCFQISLYALQENVPYEYTLYKCQLLSHWETLDEFEKKEDMAYQICMYLESCANWFFIKSIIF